MVHSRVRHPGPLISFVRLFCAQLVSSFVAGLPSLSEDSIISEAMLMSGVKPVLSTHSATVNGIAPGDHMIGSFVGRPSGSTLIAVGSLHGNEPAGTLALRRICEKLSTLIDRLNGRAYFLLGNSRALCEGTRYVDFDLNRFWTAHNLSNVGGDEILSVSEGLELTELDRLLDGILITAEDEVYVLDLHSTSAPGSPFATVGDTLRNRSFALRFPVRMILGIEEQLDGTMLEYLNNSGAVTLGFEGGQHSADETVDHHEALVSLALVHTGILERQFMPEFEKFERLLAEGVGRKRVFEVRYRKPIRPDERFQMVAGFSNFDPVQKDALLARDSSGEIRARESGVVLMPLYQKLGEDGFFLGRGVAKFWLRLSALLRKAGFQNYVRWLPGVEPSPSDPETLLINTSIARFFPLQVFHLLGFRRRRWSGKKLVVSRRKHDSKSPFRRVKKV
jgi:predicted deacylase